MSKGEVDLRVGNGARVVALEIGDCEVTLPSGLVIGLNKCYYVPSICRNIISVSYLERDGYNFIIENDVMTI
ncbi:hypothetical protein, partial [Vibrio vulnificus]